MNISKTEAEQISAFADSELDASQQEHTLALLRQPEGRQAWKNFHTIGDVLRSSDTALLPLPDFSDRMAARLAVEPSHIGVGVAASAIPTPIMLPVTRPDHRQQMRRYGISAVLAIITVLAVPKFVGLTSTGTPDLAAAGTSSGTHASTAASAPGVIRDPQINEYLLAHQRFSPSLYSTAQYVRSAPFATESAK